MEHHFLCASLVNTADINERLTQIFRSGWLANHQFYNKRHELFAGSREAVLGKAVFYGIRDLATKKKTAPGQNRPGALNVL